MEPMTQKQLAAFIDTRWGRVIAEGWTQDARRSLVIVAHEYAFPAQQRNCYRLLEAALQRCPGLPVLIEGAAGRRKTSRWSLFGSAIGNAARREAAALSRLDAEGTQAAQVLSELYPSTATIEGIETESTLEAQRRALEALDAGIQAALPTGPARLPSGAFGGAVGAVLEARAVDLEAGANDRLRHLFATERAFPIELNLVPYAHALAKIAREADVDLEGYPVVHALVTAHDLERSLDFGAVERERQALIGQLAARSDDELDGRRARAVADWLEAAAVPAGVARPRELDQFGRVQPWFERLILISLAYREQKMPMAQYQLRLQGLLDALEIPLAKGSLVAQYARYISVAQEIDSNALLTVELPGLVEELAAALTKTANERGLVELRGELRVLDKFADLRLPASKVRAAVSAPPSAGRWWSEATRLGDATLGSRWVSASDRQIAERLTAAFDRTQRAYVAFYTQALQRSEELVRRAIDRAAPAAALVCGRFHLHEAQRALRGADAMAWAIVAPHGRAEEASTQLQTWHWSDPHAETPGAVRLPR